MFKEIILYFKSRDLLVTWSSEKFKKPKSVLPQYRWPSIMAGS